MPEDQTQILKISEDQTEVLCRSVADAVVYAVGKRPDIPVKELADLAHNVACALASAFSLVNEGVELLAPRS